MKFRLSKTILAMLGVGLAGAATAATTITKETTGTDLTAGASWVGDIAPGSNDVATWGTPSTASLGGALTMATAQSWSGIDIQNATAAITISGAGELTLGSSGINIAAAGKDLTLANSLVVGAAQTWTIGSGRTLEVSGAISGAGSISMAGSGTTKLRGTNSYSGNIALQSGVLQVMSGSALGTSSSVVVSSGALLRYSNGASAAFTSSGHTVTLNDGAQLSIQGGNAGAQINVGDNIVLNSSVTAAKLGGFVFGNSTVFSGGISGVGNLQITALEGGANGGTFLNGWKNNQYVGNTTISGLGVLTFQLGTVANNDHYTPFGKVQDSTSGTATISGGQSIVFKMPGVNHNVYIDNHLILDNATITSEDSQFHLAGNVHIGAGGATLLAHWDTKSLYVDGQLTGSGALAISTSYNNSSGVRFTNGSNTYSGVISVNSSNAKLEHNTALQFATINIASTDGLQFGSGITAPVIGGLSGTANNSINGVTLTVGGNNGSTTYSGVLSGAGSLIKTGSGVLNLSGSNTYSGATTISQGTIAATNANALGSSGTVTINDANTGANNTALRIGNITLGRAITIANQGSGATTLGVEGTVATPTYSGAITLAKDVILDGTGNTDRLTFTGGIGGSGNVTIQGGSNRVVFMTTANTYSGTTTIAANSILQLSDGTSTNTSFIPDASVVTVNTGGILKLAKGANSETIGGLSGSGKVRGHEGVNNTASALVIANTGDYTFSGVLENGGAAGSTLALTKNGTGTQTLSGANTYTGNTTINSGVLDLTAGGLYTGPYNNSSIVTINSGGTLKVNSLGYSGTASLGQLADYAARRVLNGGTLEVVSGNDEVGNNFTVAANGGTFIYNPASSSNTLTLKGNGNSDIVLNGALTYDTRGNITVSEIQGGSGSITKTGSQTLTLSAANTYSGGTTVTSGTLVAGSGGAFGTGAVTVNGGTLNLNGQTLGNAITLAGGTLQGGSGYTGTISGSAGTFLAGTEASKVYTITSGGATFTELSGQGTFTGGLVTVSSTYSPGNSPGTQNFNSGLTLNGAVSFEIAANGSTNDRTNVTGGLTLGSGATLNLSLFGTADYTTTFWGSNQTFTLIKADAVNGSFATITTTDLGGAGYGNWSTAWVDNAGSQEFQATWTATAIPEPGTATLSLLGLSALLLRRRRKAA